MCRFVRISLCVRSERGKIRKKFQIIYMRRAVNGARRVSNRTVEAADQLMPEVWGIPMSWQFRVE